MSNPLSPQTCVRAYDINDNEITLHYSQSNKTLYVRDRSKLKEFNSEIGTPSGKINLSKCPNLEIVHLVNQQVASVDVSSCPKLEVLTTRCGALSSLNLVGSTNLKYLYITDSSRLKSVDISKFTKLVQLGIYGTPITGKILIDSMPFLESLSIDYTDITSVEMTKTNLNLYNCNLTYNQKLTTVYLSKANNLTSLFLNYSSALRDLSLPTQPTKLGWLDLTRTILNKYFVYKILQSMCSFSQVSTYTNPSIMLARGPIDLRDGGPQSYTTRNAIYEQSIPCLRTKTFLVYLDGRPTNGGFGA